MAATSEVYLPYALVTPLGTLNFNPDPSEGLYLTQVDGLDGATIRSDVENLPQRDGGYVYDVLRGPRYPVLSGEIRVLSGLDVRLAAMEQLVQYTDSIRFADGSLTWTPTGLSDLRGVTVRLLDAITITGGLLKTFQIPLVAADNLAYSTTQQSSNRTTAGTLNVVVAGTANTWPVVTIHGPITNPVITNTLTGEVIDLTGLTLGTTVSRVVDCKAETVVDGSGVNKIGDLVPATTSFFPLYQGVTNPISLAGSGTGANTKMTVAFNNAYV